MRTCVGCRRTAATTELVRVALDGRGTVVVGPGPGRGAWLCARSPECLEAALRRRALGRALRTELPADAAPWLRAALSEHGKIMGSVIAKATETHK